MPPFDSHRRLHTLSSHLTSYNTVSASTLPPKSDNDAVIICALRTPLCKSKKGSFKDTYPEDLLAVLYKAIVERTKINPGLIQDAIIGNVLQSGAGALQARLSQFMAEYPAGCSAAAINRQCSSGLQAIASIQGAIESGQIECGIAGGVESMTLYGMTVDVNKFSYSIFDSEGAKSCLMPMGVTSENVAKEFGISREVQDQFALESHQKAEKAIKGGLFKSEIVPVTATVKDKKSNTEKKVTVTTDEGPRPGLKLADLSKLGPAFLKGGSTTAGNASQMTDGASMCLMMKRSKAKELGLPILGRMISFDVCGLDPKIMGIGPALAIPNALKKANLSVSDIDVFEVNEAFASQATYCMEKLKIPKEKVNPNGGAIALGHPLGATGSRMVATLFPELKRRGGKLGLVSMCIGTGMGACGVFEREE